MAAAAPGFTSTQLPEAEGGGVFPPSPCKNGASQQASLATSWGKMTSYTLAKVTLGRGTWLDETSDDSRGNLP